MRRHLNTLFITTQGAYLSKDHENVVVTVEKAEKLRVPVHNLAGIVCFGKVGMSPFLMGHCAECNVAISFLTKNGRFLANVHGSTHGNVLLRRQQYRYADDPAWSCKIAKWVIVGKVANSRTQLLRFVREYHPEGFKPVDKVINHLARIIRKLDNVNDVDVARGFEGEAAQAYFSVFDHLILQNKPALGFTGRTRHPPMDRINALLSFAYTIMMNDIRSAIETVGLDPAVGFLHRDRPGRPGLALDLMEEFRPWIADRLVLSLVNRKQIGPDEFETKETGATYLNETGRKTLLTTYQNRKQEEIKHVYLGENITLGTMFFAQALLFARFIRGDIDAYPSFIVR